MESLSNAFEAGAVVDMDTLKLARLIDKRAERVKVLGNGDLDKKLTLKVHAISAGARAKVEAAGGSIELVPTTAVASEGSTTA